MERPPIRRGPATAGILLGIFLAALEGTVISTAMPSVISDLKAVDRYYLPFAVYMLAATVVVPVAGRLSDLFGRRRFHLWGVALFVAGSALCGLAQSMTQLSIYRAIQGIGGGALMPISFTMIADLFKGEERARMQGAISSVWGVASILGPPAGGFLTAHLGWRSVFYVNVPFGIAAALLVQATWHDPAPTERRGRIDWPGAVLVVLSSAALMAVFSFVRKGWQDPGTLAAAGGFAVLMALLVVVERRAPDPFLSLGLFRERIFSAGIVCGGFGAMCLFGCVTYLPLFIQAVVGGTPTDSGLVLTPMMAGWVLISFASRALLARFSYRTLAIAGSLLVALGYVLMAQLHAGSTWLDSALSAIPVGVGLGCIMAPLLIAAQESSGPERLGAATSLTQFSRTLVGAAGVGVMGAAMAALLAAAVAGIPDLSAAARDPNVVVHPILRERLTPADREALRGAMAAALRPVFFMGLAAAALSLAGALLLPGRRAPWASAATARTPGSPR